MTRLKPFLPSDIPHIDNRSQGCAILGQAVAHARNRCHGSQSRRILQARDCSGHGLGMPRSAGAGSIRPDANRLRDQFPLLQGGGACCPAPSAPSASGDYSRRSHQRTRSDGGLVSPDSDLSVRQSQTRSAVRRRECAVSGIVKRGDRWAPGWDRHARPWLALRCPWNCRRAKGAERPLSPALSAPLLQTAAGTSLDALMFSSSSATAADRASGPAGRRGRGVASAGATGAEGAAHGHPGLAAKNIAAKRASTRRWNDCIVYHCRQPVCLRAAGLAGPRLDNGDSVIASGRGRGPDCGLRQVG